MFSRKSAEKARKYILCGFHVADITESANFPQSGQDADVKSSGITVRKPLHATDYERDIARLHRRSRVTIKKEEEGMRTMGKGE